MTQRILFLAGESGSGKSTVGRMLESHATLLYADLITKRAGRHYFPGGKDNFCRWSIWSSELNDECKHGRLADAFERSIQDRKGPPIASKVIIEGAIACHPFFRSIVQRVLEKRNANSVESFNVACFWLNLPPLEIHRHIQERRRPQERDVSLQDVEERVKRYTKIMHGQNAVLSFGSASGCVAAGRAFLTDDCKL